MASAIVTARADPEPQGSTGPEDAPLRRRLIRFGESRLGGLILALNLLSLLILFGGALALDEWNRGLVQARQESLMVQAELLSNVLGQLGITEGKHEPTLDPIQASRWLRDNFIPTGQRARLSTVSGFWCPTASPCRTRSPANRCRRLPPFRRPRTPPTSRRNRPTCRAPIRPWAIEAALAGEPQATVRRSENGARVVSVSLPVRHVQQVLGVLTLEAGDVDQILGAQRKALVPFALVALAVNLLASLLLHLFVARPVMRLSAAADQVRLQRAHAISLPDLEDRRDEIGDLARSLESMTETLSARMDAIERFAADVAHGSRTP
ncbi:hypothetical protein MMB232_00207 [Brevundimonas subvibrioides]|uniref:sensor N-terminal transmembrane domain-containing protein n=1 Tax=Brevundimonas subvibrioides TaxID=74313 RepID=UPI0032D56C7D